MDENTVEGEINDVKPKRGRPKKQAPQKEEVNEVQAPQQGVAIMVPNSVNPGLTLRVPRIDVPNGSFAVRRIARQIENDTAKIGGVAIRARVALTHEASLADFVIRQADTTEQIIAIQCGINPSQYLAGIAGAILANYRDSCLSKLQKFSKAADELIYE